MTIVLKKRHFAIWLLVCTISATPSFLTGLEMKASVPAMVMGVLLFVLALTLITSSAYYTRLKESRLRFRAYQLAYGLRTVMSLLSLAFVAINGVSGASGRTGRLMNHAPYDILALHDMLSGALAVYLNQFLFGEQKGAPGFLFTLSTTLTQGVLLNFSVVITMLIIFLVLWVLVKAQRTLFHKSV